MRETKLHTVGKPRSAMVLAAFLVLSAVLVTTAIAAGADDGVECKRCKDTGWLPCSKHPKNTLDTETVAIRCSEKIKCKKCGGTLKVPCTYCAKDIRAELAATRAENEKWLEKMLEINAFMKTKNVMHCESEHFILTYNIRRITVKQRALKTHLGMHLYLERLENLYLDVIKELGAKDEDFLAKTHVMMWEREHEVVRSAQKYCRQNSNTKSYLLGAAPIFTIYYNKGFLHEEYELHQAVVHNVVHCLLSNVWNGIWPGNIKGGWIDAGYAHYQELKFKEYGGGVRNYCYREGDTNVNFKFGKWESSVRKDVDRNEAPSFLSVAAKNIDMLTPPDHMFSWSYVDFILKKYPEKFGTVALLVKKRKPIAEVMKESLGMSPFKFEEEWKAFVQESYSVKEKPFGTPISGRRRR